MKNVGQLEFSVSINIFRNIYDATNIFFSLDYICGYKTDNVGFFGKVSECWGPYGIRQKLIQNLV